MLGVGISGWVQWLVFLFCVSSWELVFGGWGLVVSWLEVICGGLLIKGWGSVVCGWDFVVGS